MLRLTITAESGDVGRGHEELAATVSGDDIEIAFNADYLEDVLGVIQSDQVVWQLSGPLSSGLLKGVDDPEKKRKIIGALFIKVFKETADKIKDAHFLAQGTIYPDVIESSSPLGGPSATIKSHHNVGGLPEELGFELIEPMREFFKDEVRRLGEELGMKHGQIWRHPFPGPGLAVRCPGEVTEEKLAILREADYILIEELRKADWYDKVAQAFAVILPVRTVGVMGDERTYEHVIALRVIDTVDFMTADFSRLPYDLLGRIASRIINEVRGVNRVVYDISTKPPSTICWE